MRAAQRLEHCHDHAIDGYRVLHQLFRMAGWEARTEVSGALANSGKRPDILVYRGVDGANLFIDWVTCVVAGEAGPALLTSAPLTHNGVELEALWGETAAWPGNATAIGELAGAPVVRTMFTNRSLLSHFSP